MAPNNWQLERLIGRVDQQHWLEQILKEDIPARHGRTVLITGPLGSGRAVLARFGLWQSLYALPRSIEIHAVDRTVNVPQAKHEQHKVVGAAVEALKDVGQRIPFPIGPLFAGLVSLWSNVSLEERQQRLVNIPPSPQSLLTLVEDAAGAGPFALYITGLDDPSLDEEWIDAIINVANYIHHQYPVALLLSTTTSQPLSELEEWQMTPVQRRLCKLLDERIVEAWHLDSVSADDVRRYVHEPADNLVIRRLHELSGGWPLMVQALWQDWRNSAQKDNGGGSRKPVIAGDRFAEPWHFTPYGLTATAHVERLLDDLLDAYLDALEMLAVLLHKDEDARATLRYILSAATLEGESFTGMALAHACSLPWGDGLEEVFDALLDAGLLIDDPDGYDEVPASEGPQPLYRYRFALPIWWHLFHQDPNFTDEERRDAARDLALALEECYDLFAWRRIAAITTLWERSGEFERVRFQRRHLDQLAYIGRLRIRAELAEQSAQRTGAWLDACKAWFELAREMQGYVENNTLFAALENARILAERGGSSTALAAIFIEIANGARSADNFTLAETAARKGLEILGDWRDADAQRMKGRGLCVLGRIHTERDELDEALRCYEEARTLKAVYESPASLAEILHGIGHVHYARKEYDQALVVYEQEQKLVKASACPEALGDNLHCVGRVYYARKELEEALWCYKQAPSINRIAWHSCSTCQNATPNRTGISCLQRIG